MEKCIMQAQDPNGTCICFKRDITNIDISHPDAGKYIDVKKQKVDSDAQTRLQQIRDHRLPTKLGVLNVHSFEIPWSTDGGINENDLVYAQYLTKLGNTFTSEIKRLVKQASQFTRDEDDIYEEVLTHLHISLKHSKMCCGFQDIMESLEYYLQAEVPFPLILAGATGSGKTTILAKAFCMVGIRCQTFTYQKFIA